MVLVAADAVEAERLGILQLIQVSVVDMVALAGVIQRVGNVHPDGAVCLAEIVRQVWPRHQVEPGELHRVALPPSALAAPTGAAGAYADGDDKVQPPTPSDVQRRRLDATIGKLPPKRP